MNRKLAAPPPVKHGCAWMAPPCYLHAAPPRAPACTPPRVAPGCCYPLMAPASPPPPRMPPPSRMAPACKLFCTPSFLHGAIRIPTFRCSVCVHVSREQNLLRRTSPTNIRDGALQTPSWLPAVLPSIVNVIPQTRKLFYVRLTPWHSNTSQYLRTPTEMRRGPLPRSH